MGLHGRVDVTVELKTSADNFYSFLKEENHIIPAISTQNVHGVELHEGDHWRSAEAVRMEIYFTSLDGTPMTSKEKLEAVDDLNRTLVFKLFGGDLEKSYKNMKAILQVIEKEGAGDGCIVKWAFEYDKVSEDFPEANDYAQFAASVTKSIGQHLITKA